MNKNILFAGVCLIISSSVFATFSIDWMKNPQVTFLGTAIALDSINNVYTTSHGNDIYLEKHDRFGNPLWNVHSPCPVQFNYETARHIFIDPQGNPIVVGYKYSHGSSSTFGHIANSLIILKYDANGNFIFKTYIDGTYSPFNNNTFWTSVTADMDAFGNVYVGTGGTVSGNGVSGFNIIKVSPSGNIIRVTAHDVDPNYPFNFVSRVRLNGDKIAVSGTTAYHGANASAWVLDTAGTTVWSDVFTGIDGEDILLEPNGETYLLTALLNAVSSDVGLYKLDPSGNQVWVHNYDFNGAELSLRLEKTPDGNIAALAKGNQAPSNWYVDPITMKIDTSGTLIWSDRYDEHTNNDEQPAHLVVDPLGNIYITGLMGPNPSTIINGDRQMVTVKYTSAGVRDWASAIDTISTSLGGERIAIGYDNSVFVVGDVNSFIVHYLDHTGTDPCSVPVNISSTVLSDSTATISWSAVTNAYLYHVRYKISTATYWQYKSTNLLTVSLTQLLPGTLYDYEVEAVCNSGPTGYLNSQQFTTTGSGYCSSMGLNASNEWIDLVYIEGILNSSPQSGTGYTDYTFLSTDLTAGITYDITLSADMNPLGSTVQWRVWIDFNHNSNFTDPGEQVVSYASNQIGWETHNFTVPSNATPGQTVMRVSMKNGTTSPTPCEIFANGEVEDYTINLLGTTGLLPDAAVNSNLVISPNPVDKFTAIHHKNSVKDVFCEVIDVAGRVILNVEYKYGNKIILNVENLKSGIYIVKLSNNADVIGYGKLIKK